MTSLVARGLAAAAALLLVGCATRPSNAPLAQYDHGYGYRVSNWQAERGDPEFGLVVAMSGGGTRAAAFSYGILEELRRTTVPTPHGSGRLLDKSTSSPASPAAASPRLPMRCTGTGCSKSTKSGSSSATCRAI